jgi:hypothetical protein
MRFRRCLLMAQAVALITLSGCATLQQIAALRQVDFVIDRVADARLAGVALDNVRNYQQVSALDVARIAAALARGDLPLDFQLHIAGLNPSSNQVAARLIQMDWTLLLDERETVSGRVDREFVFEPGVPTDIPVAIHLDLADFFQENARDMVDLALAVAGAGGEPKRISLRATPTIQTAIGPIRYPQPITIVSAELGGTGANGSRNSETGILQHSSWISGSRH